MNKIIDIAKQYLGIDNSGKEKLISYYNTNCFQLVKPERRYMMRSNDEWCMMFCSVIAHKAGYDKDNFPYEVSVYYATQKARKQGLYTAEQTSLRLGDMVVYDWGYRGGYNHVGFITEITDDYLKVIEGNYSNTVKTRTVKRTSKALQGFILLDRLTPEIEIKTDSVDYDKLVTEVLKGIHGNGDERVKNLGKHYSEVQRRINKLLG